MKSKHFSASPKARINSFLNILRKYLLNKEYKQLNKSKVVNRNISYKDLMKNQTLNSLYEDISILYCRGVLIFRTSPGARARVA